MYEKFQEIIWFRSSLLADSDLQKTYQRDKQAFIALHIHLLLVLL